MLKTPLKLIIEDCFGTAFNPDNKYVIAIQGCSTSGKSTLAKALHEELKKSDCRPFILNVDNFYKNLSMYKEVVDGTAVYDYDNPAAICWTTLVQSFKSILKGDKIIKKYTYDFLSKNRIETQEECKERYNVIIVEGIFAQNIFNKNVFNISEYDCFNSSKQIETPFIPNTFDLGDFNLLKICLDLDSETIYSSRRIVDAIRENKTPQESAAMVENFVLPSTIRWVRPTALNSSDIVLSNGTRDIHECSSVFKAISSFFGSCLTENDFESFLKKLENDSKNSAIRNQ